MCAARECTEPSHPIRSMLKQFYYRTAFINNKSQHVLAPIKCLAWRGFAFTEESWVQYFEAECDAFPYEPFPKRMAAAGLPDTVLATLPLYVDGMRTWTCIERYVRSFLGAFFPSEEALAGNDEAKAFYAYFETVKGVGWGLPALSLATLVELLSHLIFTVTVTHEVVGSVVEYLTSPSSLCGKLEEGSAVADVQVGVEGQRAGQQRRTKRETERETERETDRQADSET